MSSVTPHWPSSKKPSEITKIPFGFFRLSHPLRRVLALSCLLFSSFYSFSQGSTRLHTVETTRILFLLDASGSMNEEWQGRAKFDIARELLEEAVDSLQRQGRNIEYGLRVFGHQSPRSMQDCKDSKLEVGFTRMGSAALKEAFSRINPQGYTPIAYSLFLAANDFPAKDKKSINVIILITDGLENCDGDPCSSSEALRNNRVTLKPYIIGLGLEEGDKGQFDCVGTYYDAGSEEDFEKVLGVVVSQALKNTTVQLNLLDHLGRANETDVEVTFYDAYTGEPLYNVVHSMLRNGAPDTLFLDPTGRYNVTAHTTPPVSRQNIELIAGKHNIISLDAPQGNLDLLLEGNTRYTEIRALVRDPATGEIVYVQNFNTRHRYISGTYDLELLTIPRRTMRDYVILPGQTNTLQIPASGRLIVQTYQRGTIAVFVKRGGRLVKVHEWPQFDGKDAIDLQPGEYTLVFRPHDNKKVDQTTERKAVVYGGKSTNLRFER